MTGILINSNEISISCIELKHLTRLHEWYNTAEEYYYATGMDQPVTADETTRNYFDTLKSLNEALLGIFLQSTGRMIGILKCRFAGEAVWINQFMIESGYQNMKYGTKTIAMFAEYLKNSRSTREAYLCVSPQNIKGKCFWKKNGFEEFSATGNSLTNTLEKGKVIIMKRALQ